MSGVVEEVLSVVSQDIQDLVIVTESVSEDVGLSYAVVNNKGMIGSEQGLAICGSAVKAGNALE